MASALSRTQNRRSCLRESKKGPVERWPIEGKSSINSLFFCRTKSKGNFGQIFNINIQKKDMASQNAKALSNSSAFLFPFRLPSADGFTMSQPTVNGNGSHLLQGYRLPLPFMNSAAGVEE
jgi:hypothetical protein